MQTKSKAISNPEREALLQSLAEKDAALIAELSSKISHADSFFRNRGIENYPGFESDYAAFKNLSEHLRENRTFDLNYERKKWIDLDGEEKEVVILRAATTDMWPMGTHYWTRDNVLIAARLLFYSSPDAAANEHYNKLGREMLLSSLTIMSSLSQIKRMRQVIESRHKRFINDAHNWPYIFMSIDGNLNASKEEGWSHKQDAVQMLGFYVAEALEKGLIRHEELSRKHKEFLGMLIPFLARIDYHRQENSGSWEELPAIRSSVLCWDTLLIAKLRELAKKPGYNFIVSYFRLYKPYLKTEQKKYDFDGLCGVILENGLSQIEKMLPFEASDHKKEDSRYREADAALIYLLQTGYTYFLASHTGKDEAWAREMEDRILEQVLTLKDERTGGIRRYLNDSYQRKGFFRHVTVYKLSEIYNSPSGNASTHFTERDNIVEKGPEAAWTHFVWQLSAWAGRKHLKTGESRYLDLQKDLFRDGIRCLTGAGEVSVHQSSAESLDIIQIPALRIPECYLTDSDADGREIIFPTPHTPLNWSVAEAIDAFSVMETILKR